MNREAMLRAALVAGGERLYRAGLVRAAEGNLSARLDEASFLVTPRGSRKGFLQAWELIRAPLTGDLPQEVSSEGFMHQLVLRHHLRVGAVVHAHPPAVLSTLASGRSLDPSRLAETANLRLATLPPLPPGSRALAEAVAAAFVAAEVVLLSGHGAVAVGASVAEALFRLETTELLAAVCGAVPVHA
ncbi:MAG: class II aldolase/adducin family protein [Thermoanaerobaculum sp.]